MHVGLCRDSRVFTEYSAPKPSGISMLKLRIDSCSRKLKPVFLDKAFEPLKMGVLPTGPMPDGR